MPSGVDIERNFPERAAREGKSGAVRIRCKVTAQGKVEQCAVQSEDPLGYGFGEAALRLAPLFQMKDVVDGESVAGAEVMIPIQFRQ
jgi:periplasmic protein TonB